MNNTTANQEKIRQVTLAVIRQLNRSERGRQVLLDFRVLLDNGGWGLDDQNWEALGNLVIIARSGQRSALNEHLPREG